MIIPGRVQNGVVVLEGPMTLPEGSAVYVSNQLTPNIRLAKRQTPVVLPIFDYDGPPDVELTNERIGEIMDQEDATS